MMRELNPGHFAATVRMAQFFFANQLAHINSLLTNARRTPSAAAALSNSPFSYRFLTFVRSRSIARWQGMLFPILSTFANRLKKAVSIS